MRKYDDERLGCEQDEKKIVSDWGPFVLQYRDLMNRINNFTVSEMPPTEVNPDYTAQAPPDAHYE